MPADTYLQMVSGLASASTEAVKQNVNGSAEQAQAAREIYDVQVKHLKDAITATASKINSAVKNHETMALVTGAGLLGASFFLAYFARRRQRDVEAIIELPTTNLVEVPALVKRSPAKRVVVKIRGKVLPPKGGHEVKAPFSERIVALWYTRGLFSSAQGGRAVHIADDTGSAVVSDVLFSDFIAARYLRWTFIGVYLRTLAPPALVCEWAIPLGSEITVMAEAIDLHGEIFLRIPGKMPGAADNMSLSSVLSFQPTRFRVTHFVTHLAEDMLLQKLRSRRFVWGACAKASGLAGVSLLWWRYTALGGHMLVPLCAIPFVGLIAFSARLWFEEEIVRRQEHLFSLVSGGDHEVLCDALEKASNVSVSEHDDDDIDDDSSVYRFIPSAS